MGTNYIAPIWRMPINANTDKLSNYSIAFNPSDPNYIEISDNILSGLENFSVSVWYNTNTLSGDRAILGSWSSVPTPQMLLYWDDPDGWRFLMSDGASADVIWGTATTTNEWHHIVVTYDGAVLKFYHDNGTPVTKAVVRGPIQTRSSAWRIGSDTSNTRYWDGELSQFCLFDYALDASQVDYLYDLNNPMVPGDVNLTAPISYLPLGDNSNPNAPGSFPNISVGADSVFEFDVAGDRIDLGPESELEIGGASKYSTSIWFKKADNGSRCIWGYNYGDVNGSGFYFWFNSGALRIAVGNNSLSSDFAFYQIEAINLPIDEWQHILVVFDGTRTGSARIRVYHNGANAVGAHTRSENLPSTLPDNNGNSNRNVYLGQLQ